MCADIFTTIECCWRPTLFFVWIYSPCIECQGHWGLNLKSNHLFEYFTANIYRIIRDLYTDHLFNVFCLLKKVLFYFLLLDLKKHTINIHVNKIISAQFCLFLFPIKFWNCSVKCGIFVFHLFILCMHEHFIEYFCKGILSLNYIFTFF